MCVPDLKAEGRGGGLHWRAYLKWRVQAEGELLIFQSDH